MKLFFISVLLVISLSVGAQEVKWYTFEEAIELNKKEPRKIMVDVYTDWCGWCKVMENNTFNHAVIAAFLNESFYPVKFNAEQQGDITFRDQTYKYVSQGNRGVHELAYALLNGQMSYPSVVFLNEAVEIIHVQKGFVKPAPFDEIIKYIGGSHYLNQSWEDWKAGYTSPFSAN